MSNQSHKALLALAAAIGCALGSPASDRRGLGASPLRLESALSLAPLCLHAQHLDRQAASRAQLKAALAALSRKLESAGVPFEIQVYARAPHGFTDFGSAGYQKRADEQSWDAFADFLATSLAN